MVPLVLLPGVVNEPSGLLSANIALRLGTEILTGGVLGADMLLEHLF